MTFIPQALADPASRSILVVFHDEVNFKLHWADKVKTIDAPGVQIHPRLIKIGDVIDWFQTGWNRDKGTVNEIKFIPDSNDMPDWYRSGHFQFTCEGGYINVRVDGRSVVGPPIFIFYDK